MAAERELDRQYMNRRQGAHAVSNTAQNVNVRVIPRKIIGSWIDCLNPFDNPIGVHKFFRYVPSEKRFQENDKTMICPLCWDEAKRRNGTLHVASFPKNTDFMQTHTQCKPEKDTL